jgi:CheY-like chemotaxis protein
MQSFQPDILLLDLMMPRLNGFDVCRQVRGNSDTRHVRVLAMTGYASPSNEHRILSEGAECCLSKPIDEAVLLGAIGVPASSAATAT